MNYRIEVVNGKRYKVTTIIYRNYIPWSKAYIETPLAKWELLPSATQLDLFNG
jgi:hypothetical protein